MPDDSFDYPAMSRALILGQHTVVGEMTRQALAQGLDPKAIIFKGLIPGMDVVGEKFRRNEYYVPQVLLSARAMYAGLDLLKPLLTQAAVDEYLGTVVIGTAQGDLHDIGKNLVAMMLEGAGFKVLNLGRDVAPEKFVEAVKQNDATILGISALMTTTMPAMRRTIQALILDGTRGAVKVMIGGAPVSQTYCDEIGGDGYAKDATAAVVRAKALMGKADAPESALNGKVKTDLSACDAQAGSGQPTTDNRQPDGNTGLHRGEVVGWNPEARNFSNG